MRPTKIESTVTRTDDEELYIALAYRDSATGVGLRQQAISMSHDEAMTLASQIVKAVDEVEEDDDGTDDNDGPDAGETEGTGEQETETGEGSGNGETQGA